jgi:hypothetical protein
VRLTVSTGYEQYVVITDHAIIRIERRSEEERRQTSSIVLAVGGIVGPILAAIAALIGMPGGPTRLYLRHSDLPPVGEMKDVATCWAAEVPIELINLPGWPNVKTFRPVTFYPRSVIAAVRLSSWRGLELTLSREAAREIRVAVPLWHHGRIRKHLTRAEYPQELPTRLPSKA